MFALRHVIWQLRFLRLQFVPPFILTVLLVVSAACHTIKASPVDADHKSHRLTSSRDNNANNKETFDRQEGATTPIAIVTGTITSTADQLIRQQDYQRADNSDAFGSTHQKSKSNRIRRHAFEYWKTPKFGDQLEGQLENLTPSFENSGISNLRKFLNSDCVQYDGNRSPTSTVAKAIPCNHRWKYLDGQWEDMLYAEEPNYVVVRRETEPTYPEDNASMDFIPIRGRKGMPGNGARHESQLVHPSSPLSPPPTEDYGQTVTEAAADDVVVVRQSKRDSRPVSVANTLWPNGRGGGGGNGDAFLPVRGKKGRFDKILVKEDFLPNRGKKLLLRRLRSWLRRNAESMSVPKRGKKTKTIPKNVNSRPADLMWLTKDDFFPHRGKKDDSLENLIGDNAIADYAEAAAADVDIVPEVSGGVTFGDDRDYGYPTVWRRQLGEGRELLNNLSKQGPGDKWRGRKRSVPSLAVTTTTSSSTTSTTTSSDTDQYDNHVRHRESMATAALNENNGLEEDVAPKSIDDEAAADDDQRPAAKRSP